MMTTDHLLPYLAPPLLGAFIGYVTNYIAIRMLFRPLKPWRIFGVRLPLTPGIIPSKRHELAEKMGIMVGSHLLTSEDVGRALGKEGFRRELQGAVAEKLGHFLDRDLGPVESLVPERYRGRFRDLIDLLRWRALKAVFDYLESAEFETKLRGFLQRKGNEWLARDLESFLTPERYEALRHHLDGRLSEFLHSAGVERAVAGFIDGKTEQWLSSDHTLRQILPADLIEVILGQLEKEIPPLLEKFGGLLYDPEFRERLVEKGKEGIEDFLDSLGGLSGLLAGLSIWTRFTPASPNSSTRPETRSPAGFGRRKPRLRSHPCCGSGWIPCSTDRCGGTWKRSHTKRWPACGASCAAGRWTWSRGAAPPRPPSPWRNG